jgi:hypothetical protein
MSSKYLSQQAAVLEEGAEQDESLEGGDFMHQSLLYRLFATGVN